MSEGTSAKPTSLICRNVYVAGHRTSVRMELILWDAFDEIATREKLGTNKLITLVNQYRGQNSLTAALRVFLLRYYRQGSSISNEQKTYLANNSSAQIRNNTVEAHSDFTPDGISQELRSALSIFPQD